LLRDIEISRPDQVWGTDVTYVPMPHGFLYLAAIMDWYSRCVLAWRLSNTLEGTFCLEACGVAISMDGRGRAIDNVFIERLWRSVKYEEVYLKDYATAREAEDSLASCFRFCCDQRIHQALDYRTPAELYFEGA
jgi:putative transposase